MEKQKSKQKTLKTLRKKQSFWKKMVSVKQHFFFEKIN